MDIRRNLLADIVPSNENLARVDLFVSSEKATTIKMLTVAHGWILQFWSLLRGQRLTSFGRSGRHQLLQRPPSPHLLRTYLKWLQRKNADGFVPPGHGDDITSLDLVNRIAEAYICNFEVTVWGDGDDVHRVYTTRPKI